MIFRTFCGVSKSPKMSAYLLFGIFGGMLFSGVLPAFSVFATQSSLIVSIANNITLDLNPTSIDGTFATSSTADNISITTNNYSGYTLGIIPKTNLDTSLAYDNGNNTVIIPSISSEVSASDYANSSYAKTHNLNNTWGYKPNKLYDPDEQDNIVNNNYLPAPSSTSQLSIIAKTAAPNADTPDDYNISIGARVDLTIPPGSYSNTFTIIAVANPLDYSISFDKGTYSGTPTKMPSKQTGVISDPANNSTDITLPDTIPGGYGGEFFGWCSVMPVYVSDTDTCDGEVYQPGDAYTLDATISNTNIILYAMWRKPAIVFKAGSGIDAVIVKRGTTLNYAYGDNEIRISPPPNDGTQYIVTVVPSPYHRLGSWTSSVDNTGLASQTLLTTTYTTNGSETLIANGVYTSAGDPEAYPKMRNVTLESCSTSGNNVTDERNGRSYAIKKIEYTSGDTMLQFCFMLSNLRIANEELLTFSSNVTGKYTLPASVGTSEWEKEYCIPQVAKAENGEYYYNWAAATARVNSTSGSSSCSMDAGNSMGDICPANWALPKNGDDSGLDVNNSIFRAALYNNATMLHTGYVYTGGQSGVGSSGKWWSSGRSGNANAYFLSASNSTSAISRSLTDKYFGHSVRCMLKPSDDY